LLIIELKDNLCGERYNLLLYYLLRFGALANFVHQLPCVWVIWKEMNDQIFK